jgi:DNA-binding transcriptional ArsR family regulator
MFQAARSSDLDAVFGALADASRRSILARLTSGETSVSELAKPLDMTLPAVLKHLRVLEDAGLISAAKDGRVKQCRLKPEPLRTASDWLTSTYNFWNTQLDGLSRHLESGEPTRSIARENASWPHHQSRRSKSTSGGSTGNRARKSSKRGRTRKS